MSRIQLDDMVIFGRVADAQSFTRAARALDIPTSTVSRRVTQLEESLGVRLLHRTTRKLSLTDIGAAYAERCLAIQAEVEEANSAVSSASAVPRGTLRLTAPVEIGRRHLARLVAQYGRLYPAVRVSMTLTNRFVDLVGEGFDVGIRVGELEDSSLIAKYLGPASQLLCASPEYLDERGVPRTVAELERHRVLAYEVRHDRAVWGFLGPKGETSVSLNPHMSSNDFSVLLDFATSGLGIAQLPSFVAADALRRGELAQVLQDHRPSEVGTFAIYPTRRHLSAKVRSFLEILSEEFSPPPWAHSCILDED